MEIAHKIGGRVGIGEVIAAIIPFESPCNSAVSESNSIMDPAVAHGDGFSFEMYVMVCKNECCSVMLERVGVMVGKGSPDRKWPAMLS